MDNRAQPNKLKVTKVSHHKTLSIFRVV